MFRLFFALFRLNRNTETRCFDIEPKQPKQSSFGCFESKLVSQDTLVDTLHILFLAYVIQGGLAHRNHRNQTISRRWANIISRRPSHGHLARRSCPQVFLRIFSEVTYIRTVRNSTLLKIYTLPNQPSP
jgi:hypothetical protein